ATCPASRFVMRSMLTRILCRFGPAWAVIAAALLGGADRGEGSVQAGSALHEGASPCASSESSSKTSTGAKSGSEVTRLPAVSTTQAATQYTPVCSTGTVEE